MKYLCPNTSCRIVENFRLHRGRVDNIFSYNNCDSTFLKLVLTGLMGTVNSLTSYELRINLHLTSYYKSELELKSNSSEILPVNCKFIYLIKSTKLKLEVLKSDF